MDLATLGIRVESTEVATADQRLDRLTRAASRAEAEVDDLALAARRADGSVATMNVALADQARSLAVVRNGLGLTANESLNVSRQFADVGVSLASGMNPALVALQQGPQLFEVFQVAAIRAGTSIRAAMLATGAAIATALAPFAPLIAAVTLAAGVIGGGLALAARGANREFSDLEKGLGLTDDQLKKVKDSTIGLGDIAVATFQEIGEAIMDAFDGPIATAQRQTTSFLDELTANTVKEARAIVGTFVGAYDAIRATWRMLPAAIGDAAVSAANAAIRAIEALVNAGAQGINRLLAGLRALSAVNPTFAWARAIRDIGGVDLGQLSNPNAGAMAAVGAAGQSAYGTGYARGEGYVDAGIDAVGRRARDNEIANIRRQAGDAGDSSDTARAAREATEELRALASIDLQPLNVQLDHFVTPLDEMAYQLLVIDGLTRDMAVGLESAFGQTGRALGEMMTTMTSYQAQMAAWAAEEADMIRRNQVDYLRLQEIESQRAHAQVQSYGDMLGAAKSFFREGSDGYRVLQAAEAAWRVFQFAMSVQAMAQSAAETGVSVSGSLAKGAASAAAGAAKMFEALGPFAFPVVAAMIGVLASMGLRGGSSGAGGGGGTAANDNASLNDSVARSQGQSAAADQQRSSIAAAVAQTVEIKVTADREGLNAYVVGTAENVARPMVLQGMAAASGATRAQVMTDLERSQTYRRGVG